MKTRSSSQTKNIELPTAPKEEDFKFGAAHAWNRGHLDKLGVTFWRGRRIDLDTLLTRNHITWDKAQRDSASDC